MGQFLLWVELVIASVLYVALGQAICARLAWKSFRWPCNGLWCLLLLVPWAGVLAIFGVMYKEYPSVCGQAFISAVLAALVMLIACTRTILTARKNSPDDSQPASLHWSPGKLSVYWLITFLLACGTFWVMDQMVAQHMNPVRLEASQLALAVMPEHVADKDNAAPLIDQAAGMLKALGNQTTPDKRTFTSETDLWLNPQEGPYNPVDPQMLEYIQKAQPAIALLHKAAAKPGYDPGTLFNPPDFTILLPYMGDIRNMANILCISARIHEDHGQVDLALADLHAAEALGRFVAGQPTLVGTLTGGGVNRKVFDSYQYMLDKGNLPAEIPVGDWEENGFVLHRQVPRVMQMEQAMMLSVYATPDTLGMFAKIFGPAYDSMPPLVVVQLPGYRAFFLEKDLAAYLENSNHFKNSAILPYPELEKKFPRDVAGSITTQGLVGDTLAPVRLRAMASISEADARARMMTLSRGMMLYRQANGKYPDSLDELAPKYISALPSDPFSDELLKMADKDGRRILYSIGRDMKDDQGVPPTKPNTNEPGDIVLILPK